jgi:hypothetical protein
MSLRAVAVHPHWELRARKQGLWHAVVAEQQLRSLPPAQRHSLPTFQRGAGVGSQQQQQQQQQRPLPPPAGRRPRGGRG